MHPRRRCVMFCIGPAAGEKRLEEAGGRDMGGIGRAKGWKEAPPGVMSIERHGEECVFPPQDIYASEASSFSFLFAHIPLRNTFLTLFIFWKASFERRSLFVLLTVWLLLSSPSFSPFFLAQHACFRWAWWRAEIAILALMPVFSSY